MIVWLGKVTANGSTNSVEFTSISQSYKRLILTGNFRSNTYTVSNPFSATGAVQFNGSNASTYGNTLAGQTMSGGSASTAVGYSGPAADDKWTTEGIGSGIDFYTATNYGSSTNMTCLWMEIHNYTSTTTYQKKGVQTKFGVLQTGPVFGNYPYLQYETGAVDTSLTAVTSIQFKLNTGSDEWVSGSYWNLYGVSNTN
jgi:hypothetical protein|tara:strand:- start:41 stop:634 length:594 start_codon:yes stop_codon:yes gene_type:complete